MLGFSKLFPLVCCVLVTWHVGKIKLVCRSCVGMGVPRCSGLGPGREMRDCRLIAGKLGVGCFR